MSISYSNTIKGFNPENYDEKKEPEKVKGTGKFSKLMKIVIPSAIVLVVVAGIIVLAVVFSGGGKSDKPKKPIIHIDENTTTIPNVTLNTDNADDSTNFEESIEKNNTNNSTTKEDNEPIFVKPKEINIAYNEGELKFFNIQKNISSEIKGEENKTQENEYFNYISVLGIKTENKEENTNRTYFDGFFAICCSSYFNKTTKKEDPLFYNIELNKIMNENNQNQLIKDLEKQYLKKKNVDNYENKNFFLKISFYNDGTYKNISRPNNLSEENYKEMKDFLDLIIPERSNKNRTVDKIDQETIEKVRLFTQNENAKNDKEEDINYIKILRKGDDKQNDTGYKIKGINSNDSYYINDNYNYYSNMKEDEEKKNITYLNSEEKNENNITKLNTYEDSWIYLDNAKFRGSNRTKNSLTYIDESNGSMKEAFSITYMNLSNQSYLDNTDKIVYNEDNSIKEDDIINGENEANITDQNEETNNNTKNDYNFKENMYVEIYHHIKLNKSYYDENAIDNIYNRYLGNFSYEENNSTLRRLNRLKRALSLNNLDKYEIIEGNNIRNLQEFEGESFYGQKKVSYRRDLFKTNFLGLDIALGLINTYYPNKGQSIFNFKVDIGEFHISQDVDSFKTNQPIIIENIQQMSYKLLKMMYFTHINLEKQNKINYNKINTIFENLLDVLNITNEANSNSFSREDIYLIFSQNKDQYQIYIDDLLNNSIIVNNNLTDSMTSFNSTRSILENYLNSFINNVINKINFKLEDIEKTILDLNKEIKKNDEDIGLYLYLYEDYRTLVEKIKRYINYDLKKYLEKELNKGEIIFISEKDNNINEIMNLNKINIIMNSIGNKIFDHIFSKEEQDSFSSYLKELKSIFETNNISFSFESLTDSFQKKIKNEIISNISNISNILEEADYYLDMRKKNISEYNDIEEYYNQINKIEDIINNIITFYIKNYSDNLFNKYTYAYESINNITKNLQEKVFDFGKSVRNYLFEIKNEKNLNKINQEETYFENNMFDLYNISYQRINSIFKENSENYTLFDIIFIESLNNSIMYWTKYYIDKNFQLAYDYLNEAKDFVDSCKETKFLFIRVKCEFYLNSKFIKTLNDMSKKSVQIVENIDTNDFLNEIEEYYNSFQKEFEQKKLKINEEICTNNKGFSYLYNISDDLIFNFTKIKSKIKNITQDLYQYSNVTQESFLYDFNNFTKKKKGTFSLFNYDVYLPTDTHKCSNRNNYKYLYINNSLIKAHLKDDKERVINNYLEEQKDIEAFIKKYCNNLILNVQENFNENKYKINLYFMFEKYKSDIINILESFTNYEFIKALFDEYQNYFYNISLAYNEEYLNELISNLSQIYSNIPYLGNEEIQKIDEDINLLKNLDVYKKDSDVRFNSSIKQIFDNKIRMIINLNEKIFNYIISNLNNDENLKEEIGIIELNFKDINKIINNYKNNYQNSLENISNSIKNESFDSFDLFNDIKNFSSILEILYNNTKNNNTVQNNLLLKYIKEIKIKREIEGIERLISNNEYNIEIDKNLIPELNVDNVKLLYDQIRFDISNEANNIISNDIKQEFNNYLYNYSLEIFYEIEKIYKDNYKKNKTLNLFDELISEIDYDFIEEVEKDLNILYKKLFDLIGKYILLNNTYPNIDFQYINKKYYDEILSYLNLALDTNNINNISRNDDEEKNKMKDIIFISIKRLEEKKIRYIKSYLNNHHKKYDYDSFHKEESIDSIISIIYEENKKDELYPLYLEIFKELNNINFKLLDMDRNKTSFEKIKNIALNLYEKNYNSFKENFANNNINYFYNERKNDSLLNLIEEEIGNILNEIKNIIKNSIEETQNLSLDGYYLKRHIINSFENKMNLNVPKDFNSIEDFINDNGIKMEYFKIKAEKIYDESISNKLKEIFNYTLKDYYYDYQCYELEVSKKINLLYDNYFYSMLSYSENLIKNVFNYLHIIIDEKDIYGNSTYEKIGSLSDILLNIILKQIEEDLDTFYSEASYMKNKNILIKASMSTIFNDKYMKEVLLTNKSKNSLIYNDIIMNNFKKCIDKIIYDGSKSFSNFNHEKKYNDLETYWSENIIPISIKLKAPSTNSILSFFENLISGNKNAFAEIDKLLKILENQFNNLNITDKLHMNNETVKLIMLDLEKRYKINGIDTIINKYEKLMEAVIENNTTNKLDFNLTNNLTDYFNSSVEFINDFNNVITNYSISLLNEIKDYCYKLKVFVMIDGLNYIPVEKAEKLRVLWDYSNKSEIPNNLTSSKLMNIERVNEYLKDFDKKNKKDILRKMEKIFNNNSSLNYQDEYNSTEFFNSKSEPLTKNNILEMIDNLNNDVNNFYNMIKNNEYFNEIKLNYELLKKNFEKEYYNNNILKFELSFISFLNSNIYFDYLDYLESIEVESNPQKEAEKQKRKELIDFIENNTRLNDLNILSNIIIVTIYSTYLNTINKQSKILNIIDADINKLFKKNIGNVDKLLENVNSYKIFSKVKDNIENIENALTIEIDDIIDKFSKFEKIYFDLKRNDFISNYFLNFLKFKYSTSISYCYPLNLTEKIPGFPLILPVPSFPVLQLRIFPIVNITACSEIEYKLIDFDLTQVFFNFNTNASVGLDLEGGLYLDAVFLHFSASVGIKGNLFDGRVGIKILVDFDNSKLYLTLYFEVMINIKPEFFVLVQAKIDYIWKKDIFKWSKPIKILTFPELYNIDKDFDKMVNLTNDENNYLL